MIPTWMPVVAVALSDDRGRFLLQQCPPGKHHAGLWEFPGGKVESEETPRLALVREIAEELGIGLDPQALNPVGLADAPEQDGRPTIVLLLYSCTAWEGEPRGVEGQRLGWFERQEAEALPMPPMDRQLLENLPRLGIAKL